MTRYGLAGSLNVIVLAIGGAENLIGTSNLSSTVVCAREFPTSADALSVGGGRNRSTTAVLRCFVGQNARTTMYEKRCTHFISPTIPPHSPTREANRPTKNEPPSPTTAYLAKSTGC
jgi:hypothetical protein